MYISNTKHKMAIVFMVKVKILESPLLGDYVCVHFLGIIAEVIHQKHYDQAHIHTCSAVKHTICVLLVILQQVVLQLQLCLIYHEPKRCRNVLCKLRQIACSM